MLNGTMNHPRANPNIIYPDFNDSVSYHNKNKEIMKTSRTSRNEAADVDQHSLTNFSCSFYIVCEQEIVGRYGEDLAGAFKHLYMFGNASSQQKKKVNRAIIPVINYCVEHPERILQYCYQITNSCELMLGASIESYIDYCFWQDRNALKQMQIIVQNEYNILFPDFTRESCRQQRKEESEIIIDVPPELRGESQSMKIRNACYSYFQNLVVQLDILPSCDGDHLPITK